MTSPLRLWPREGLRVYALGAVGLLPAVGALEMLSGTPIWLRLALCGALFGLWFWLLSRLIATTVCLEETALRVAHYGRLGGVETVYFHQIVRVTALARTIAVEAREGRTVEIGPFQTFRPHATTRTLASLAAEIQARSVGSG